MFVAASVKAKKIKRMSFYVELSLMQTWNPCVAFPFVRRPAKFHLRQMRNGHSSPAPAPPSTHYRRPSSSRSFLVPRRRELPLPQFFSLHPDPGLAHVQNQRVRTANEFGRRYPQLPILVSAAHPYEFRTGPAIVVASHDARANHDRYRGTIQHTERTNAVVPVAGETLRYIRRRQAHVREIRRVEPMRTGRTEAAEFGPKFSDVYAFDVPHHDQVIPRIRHVIGVTMRRGRVVVVRRCRNIAGNLPLFLPPVQSLGPYLPT